MIVKYNDDSNLLLRQYKQQYILQDVVYSVGLYLLIKESYYALHEFTWGSVKLTYAPPLPNWVFGEEFSGGGVGENSLYIVFV